jgi:hypothetical protein
MEISKCPTAMPRHNAGQPRAGPRFIDAQRLGPVLPPTSVQSPLWGFPAKIGPAQKTSVQFCQRGKSRDHVEPAWHDVTIRTCLSDRREARHPQTINSRSPSKNRIMSNLRREFEYWTGPQGRRILKRWAENWTGKPLAKPTAAAAAAATTSVLGPPLAAQTAYTTLRGEDKGKRPADANTPVKRPATISDWAKQERIKIARAAHAFDKSYIQRVNQLAGPSSMPRTYARTAGARRSRRKPRLTKRRRRYTKKKTKFSTKGFRTYQQNYFSFDANNDIVKPGTENGSDYHDAFFTSALDTATNRIGWQPICVPPASTIPFNLIYARVTGKLSNFISSSNLASQFTKFRVNWVKHTWYFPDQAADTANDKWPLILWINYGDIKRVNIDGYGEQAVWGSRDELIERPGWKRIVLKRKNKFSFKFRPHLRLVDEYGTFQANSEVDKNKLKPMKFMGTDDAATSSIAYFGPTIAMEMPNSALFGNNTDISAMEAFTGNAGTWDVTGTRAPVSFLNYTSVKVTASVSFKDPDNEAQRGLIV